MRPRFGRYDIATRLNSFRTGGRSVAEAIRWAASVDGLTALELNFPQHLVQLSKGEVVELLDETGFRLTALNLRFEGSRFARGAFTSPDERTRMEAIQIAFDAVDFASSHGAKHVVLWMADDGWDYPLQVDYRSLWTAETDAFCRIAQRNPDIRVSVEYKPTDPRRRALIANMGEALLATRDVARANFGVTLDVCHSLMAGESPAAAASLALGVGQLFGVHLNDGYGLADDGLMIGSVRPVQLLELLMVLRDGAYDGTIYFDTFPVREDPAEECAANVMALTKYEALVDRLESPALRALLAQHDAVGVRRLLVEAGLV